MAMEFCGELLDHYGFSSSSHNGKVTYYWVTTEFCGKSVVPNILLSHYRISSSSHNWHIMTSWTLSSEVGNNLDKQGDYSPSMVHRSLAFSNSAHFSSRPAVLSVVIITTVPSSKMPSIGVRTSKKKLDCASRSYLPPQLLLLYLSSLSFSHWNT